MSLTDLGKNDISEETQALKDRLASRDTENAGLQTRLMRREAELEELQATLSETVYKLSKEAQRALQLEEEVSARSSELKTEHIALQNTELALQSAQEKLKAEERAKRELESTLDTVSLHSQTTSAEHQSVQREKRALESRVRELERIVQTHEAKGASNMPRKNGRSRSSSVSNFRLPAVEQELNDTKAQLHAKDTSLRVLEQKLAQVRDNLVKAENACISIDKAGQKRISELLSILERKEEELESLRETDNAGEREEELLKRIDEDAAKIAALEKLAAESQAARASQAKIQILQSQLKVECEKVLRSADLQNRLLHEKDELLRQHEASKREIYEGHELLVVRERQIKELEAKNAHLLAEPDDYSRRKESLSADPGHSSFQPQGSAFPNESVLADHIQTLLQAIDRLRDERDELKRALEFSEVEYRITTECFQSRVATLTRQLERLKQSASCAAAFAVVISNQSTHLDLAEQRFLTLNKNCQDMESERSFLALRITNLQDDLTRVQDELSDTQNHHNTSHAQHLSTTSTFEVVQALKDRIQELEACIVQGTNQISGYQHDIHRLETNVKLYEERIAEITSERELLASQKEAMVDDCAEARKARDDAIERLATAQEKGQELVTANQLLEEARSSHAEVEAGLLERIATMTTELQAQSGQAENIASLQVELEDVKTQLQNSLENFADLEKLHGDVVQEFTTAQEVFERRFAETDEQIRTLDVDHQHAIATVETKYRHEADILVSNLEDREHEVDELRQQLCGISEAHTRVEEKFREESKSYQVRHALAEDLEKDLRRTIVDMRQRLAQTEAETLAIQEERRLLRVQITDLQAEIQRSTSLTHYLESQVRESHEACMVSKESLERSELSLVESEKAAKAAEFRLTLQTTQHEKVVAVLRREIASFQSGPELRSALADLEERNREMDDLLRAKCQEIEEYDDRILETLKANKKLTNKIESLTRKVQALQVKLSLMKTQSQEPVAEATPSEKVTFTIGQPVSAPVPATIHIGSYPSSSRIRQSSAPSMSKTPEPQPVAALPSSQTPGRMNEPSGREMSAGKKRPAPDDDERDSVPAEGHYSIDECLRNGPTPRLRRAHGHPAGFTPKRGASARKPAELPSPGRRVNAGMTPSEVITDVTNSPRGSSGQGDIQLRKRSWLGKIRGGAGPQPASSRLGAFGGQ